MSHWNRLVISPPESTTTTRTSKHTHTHTQNRKVQYRRVEFKRCPMEQRHKGNREMTTAWRRRRHCCLVVGAAIFSACGPGRSSSSVAAFGSGGGLSRQSVSRSLRWVGSGSRSEALMPRPGSARIRSRTPSPSADGEALSATSRRRSAFVVEGGVGPAAASTTQDWRDLSIEVRRGFAGAREG